MALELPLYPSAGSSDSSLYQIEAANMLGPPPPPPAYPQSMSESVYSFVSSLVFGSNSNAAAVELKRCRVCERTENQDDLICPCRCTNSQKYAHTECLDKFRTSGNTPR